MIMYYIKCYILYLLCREEELPELETLVRAGASPVKAQGGVESKQGKANVLIQVMILACRHKQFLSLCCYRACMLT